MDLRLNIVLMLWSGLKDADDRPHDLFTGQPLQTMCDVFTLSCLHGAASLTQFLWDPDKARRNLNKHDVAFEDAELV
jgi:hypothetical protein